MTINDKTLENLSKLSKIKIDDNLRDKLKEDLNLTMSMIDEINKLIKHIQVIFIYNNQLDKMFFKLTDINFVIINFTIIIYDFF